VFLVTIDTFRADHLGCYGYRRKGISPHIDRLAREAVVFEQPIAQASWTKPSFGSIVTGLYPHRHGAIDRPDHLGEVETLAQRLSAIGFTTIAVVANAWVGARFGFEKGFRIFDETYAGGRETYLTDAKEVNERLWAALDKVESGRLFVWLVYIDPHDPYAPPGQWGQKYSDPGFPAGWPQFPPSPGLPAPLRILDENGEPVTVTAPIGQAINLYDGEVAYTDEQMGRLMEGLAERGLDDNSLIIFTSDHGEEFMEHGGWHHGSTLHQDQVHVPLIFRYPSTLFPPRTRIGGTVSLVDIVPTVFEALGEPIPESDGVSLLPLIREARPSTRDAYSHETLTREHGVGGFIDTRCVLRGRYKLIHILKRIGRWNWPDASDQFQLYDLEQDPYERNDLWEGKGRGRVKAELRDLIGKFESGATRSTGPAPKPEELPPEVRENLKALGYVQ